MTVEGARTTNYIPRTAWRAIKRGGIALAGLSLLLSGQAPAFPVPAGSQAGAQKAYNRAIRLRTALESHAEAQRELADYQKTIRAFDSVYKADPAFHLSPQALAAEAALYEEMGRRFSNDRYYLKSIQTFQTLMAKYPNHQMAADALYTIGEIYRTDLEDPVEARTTFADFIQKYPNANRSVEARNEINKLDVVLTKWKEKSGPPPAEIAEQKQLHAVPEVTDIRDWVGPNYTRVVISVEGSVTFNTARLKDPDRIYFDLQNSRLSAALVGKTFPVEDGFLRQIRIAQYKPTVTRVVLDVEKIRDYSVFPLPNPFRLVIDIHGPPAPLVASGQKPGRSSESAAEEKPAKLSGAASTTAEVKNPPALPASKSAERGKSEAEAATAEAPPRPAADATPTPKGSAVANPGIKTSSPIGDGSRTLTRALGLKIARIVIDPGHGGYDTGTIGPDGSQEKDVVLDVGLRLRKLLEAKTGSEVYMTRSTDTFIPLEERTAIANEKGADLFISIHANASRDSSARGLETYYLNFTSDPEALALAARENASSQESVHQLQDMIKKIALNEKIEESQEFARDVQQLMSRDLTKAGDSQPNRGIKKAPFVVLIGANMPSILAEISFLTNPRDARLLKRASFRQKIAEALYDGVVRYMNELGEVNVAQQVHASSNSAADPNHR